jgi:H+/Cl- antiporter ClcA
MKLSRRGAIALLIVEIVPLVHMVVFVGFMVAFLFTVVERVQEAQQQRLKAPANAPAPPPPMPFATDGFMALMVVHMIGAVLLWVLIGFNIVYIVKSPRFEMNEKLIWILVVIFTSFIGMLIFWFLRIWPDAKRAVAIPRGEGQAPPFDRISP